ncbi:hypothetical protein [Frigoribacterium sp. MCBA15_019]|uniref:hypothetical protein n=1 Tax=unclassified Frigoribacterium TaxID=2627005 RepID=UPI0008DC8B35|nr:hypothetical protein [Frigoribacterium sp. MCBA15_019]OII27740.1 hypothetical protein BIV04_04355 [Frigoribacterium sp. MCBA15_019]
MRRPSRLIALVASVAVAAGLMTAAAVTGPAAPASAAADARQFDAGNIISNDTFYNSAAMTPESIQSFLNSKVVTCRAAAGQSCLKDYTQTTSGRAATPYCSAIDGRNNESAASIIYRVGQVCGINPQVLLVMLQKEQGLVQSVSPTATAYKIAMGYGCPDTAPCDTAYYGFFNQVYNAASQFQRYTKTSSSWSYQPGRNNNVYYHPNAGCGTKTVYIVNQATANLYLYTPYTPNQAALNAGYGTGDSCSAYGNRNFYLYFTDWFGNPSNWLQSASFEGGSVSGWGWSNGAINRAAVNSPALSQNGDYFLAMNTSVVGRAITQDVTRTTNVGEQATATAWVRSGSAASYSGEMVLWGLGGSQEVAISKFTVGTSWTKIQVKLPVRASAHSTIRLDVYMGSNTGDLWLDNTELTFGAAPKPQNELSNASFEGSFAQWIPGNGFVNQQIYRDENEAVDGSWFAASNTPARGRSFAQTVPVSTTSTNQRYTFSIWLRSDSATTPFKGTLALWGLGGSANVVEQTPFTVDSTWQKITVSTDMNSTASKQLKAEVYMETTNATLWLDGGGLSDNLLSSGSFEGASSTGWVRGDSRMNLAVYSKAQLPPKDGTYLAATNTPVASSLYQTVSARPLAGETYTAELWVRSGGPTPFKGRLALWALGGATEAGSSSFTTTDAWTKVTFEVPITHDDHTQFKFEIYQDSTDSTLLIDSAQVY